MGQQGKSKPKDNRPARGRYRAAQRWVTNQKRNILRHLRNHPGDYQAHAFAQKHGWC